MRVEMHLCMPVGATLAVAHYLQAHINALQRTAGTQSDRR